MVDEGAGPELRELRQRLDQVDEEIVRAIARRLEAVGLIAQAKAGRAEGIRDPEREHEVLARVEGIARSLGISAPLARKVFSELIVHSLTRQAASLSGEPEPGRTIAPSFEGLALTLKNGKILTGIRVEETGANLTLADNQGQKHVIAKADIDERMPTNQSVMPEGIEKRFSLEEFVDLIAFLVSQKEAREK